MSHRTPAIVLALLLALPSLPSHAADKRAAKDADGKAPKAITGPGTNSNSPKAPAASNTGSGEATPSDQITAPPGFTVERLYSVPKATQGSWVCICVDPKNRLIVSDQYGGLFRVTPPAIGGKAEDTKVEVLTTKIGLAQGLLVAGDFLYVVVNDTKGLNGNASGLYRLPYDAAAGTVGDPQLLKVFPGRNGKERIGTEHGPHAVRLGPDGKLYVVAGNFTGWPEGVSPTTPVKNYAEDQLLPRNADGGGHDPDIWAPAGCLHRCDPDGKNWEVVCGGMRNTYDFDFNADGELFGWDSDMEWDIGAAWYRPTRVLMAASAAEFGWRNGTGKWPDYYPDSLGAVVNTGLGSPTGVTFGYGAKFPAKYQEALFLVDWAYGKVYAAHLTPAGAGYRATFDVFLEGKAFDGTDIVVGKDGALYMTIGGRKTQSGLYRIAYTGSESTEPAKPAENAPAAAARAERHKLEAFHGKHDPQAVAIAWEYLNSPDRYLRFAAQKAIEWQDVAQWQEKALNEKRPTALANAIVALARSANPAKDGPVGEPPVYASSGDPALEAKVLASLGGLSLKSLSEEQLLEALRAYELTFIRLGKPTADQGRELAARFDALYPSPSYNVNHELVQLLAYLDAPTVVAKSMKLLAAAPTQEQQMHYVLALRVVTAGWTPDSRKSYFAWLNYAEKNYHGGNSFGRFLAKIRADALETLTPAEKTALAAIVTGDASAGVAPVPQGPPRQFVRNWQMGDLASSVNNDAARGRSFDKGKAAFDATGCIKCHRFGNEGGGTGPDLTGVGARFSPADVLESILLPSKVISDQYQATEVRTTDGDVLLGNVESEDANTVKIRTNPYSLDSVAVKKSDVKSRQPSKLSLMPEGLVDVLTKDEVLDLIAYVRSAGNAKDKAFAP